MTSQFIKTLIILLGMAISQSGFSQELELASESFGHSEPSPIIVRGKVLNHRGRPIRATINFGSSKDELTRIETNRKGVFEIELKKSQAVVNLFCKISAKNHRIKECDFQIEWTQGDSYVLNVRLYKQRKSMWYGRCGSSRHGGCPRCYIGLDLTKKGHHH